MRDLWPKEMPVRHDVVQTARTNIHVDTRVGLIQAHKERIVDVHQEHDGKHLPGVGVAGEDKADVLPHDGFYGCPGLVGHHDGGDSLSPPRES